MASSYLAARLPPDLPYAELVQFMDKHNVQFSVSTRVDKLTNYLCELEYVEKLKSTNTIVSKDSQTASVPSKEEHVESPKFAHLSDLVAETVSTNDFSLEDGPPNPVQKGLNSLDPHDDDVIVRVQPAATLENFSPTAPPDASFEKISLLKEMVEENSTNALMGVQDASVIQRTPISTSIRVKKAVAETPVRTRLPVPPFPPLRVPSSPNLSSTNVNRGLKLGEVKEEVEDPLYSSFENKWLAPQNSKRSLNHSLTDGLPRTPHSIAGLSTSFMSGDLFRTPATRPQSLPMSSSAVPLPLFLEASVKEESLDELFGKPPLLDQGEDAADLLDESKMEKSHKEDENEDGKAKACFAYSSLKKKTQCDICSKTFAFPSLLKVHYRIHESDRPFKCDYCPLQFNQSIRLLNHRRKHTGEKPFACDVCGKCYSTNGALKQHVQIHSGVRPFECLVCGKRFLQKAYLTQHVRIHTGEKPYECSRCHKTFRQQSNLYSHFHSKHSE